MDSVLQHCLSGGSPLAIHTLLESAAFYWTMDDNKKIYNKIGYDSGVAPSGANTIKGIKGKAVYIESGASGAFTLNEGLPHSECLFNTSQCNEGFTLMLWLWYKHKDAGQVFLATSGDNYRGHRIFQTNTNTPQVGEIYYSISDTKFRVSPTGVGA